MATHSSLLVWEIPWTEEPGFSVHEVTKELDTTEWLNSNNNSNCVSLWIYYNQLSTLKSWVL